MVWIERDDRNDQQVLYFAVELQYNSNDNQDWEQMKLMKIYEIQKNYIMHKSRLMSINTTNNKVKTMASLQNNLNKINNYKRTKILSEVFIEKQKIDKIYNENENLRNKMIEVSKRQNELIKEKSFMRSSSKSLKKQNFKSQITKQNIKFRQRIMRTKSNYYNLHNKKQKKHKTSYKNQQIVHLLQNHFGIKPTVVFPHVKKRVARSTLKQKREHERHHTQSNTQGLNNTKQRHSLSIKHSMDVQSV